MNADQIHAKIYMGRGKAALRLGLDHKVFRPASASDPLTNQVATIKAAFNACDNVYRSPDIPGDAYWYGDFDGQQTLPGDYLVRVKDGQTLYVAAQQQLLPIICVECNRTIRVARSASQAAPGAVGAIGYSGACDAPAESSDVIGANPAGGGKKFIGWPCSILFGGKSQISIGLPTGVRNTGWRILLPPSVPVVLRAGDIAVDDLGRRYTVEGTELSDTGWRINAQEAHT